MVLDLLISLNETSPCMGCSSVHSCESRFPCSHSDPSVKLFAVVKIFSLHLGKNKLLVKCQQPSHCRLCCLSETLPFYRSWRCVWILQVPDLSSQRTKIVSEFLPCVFVTFCRNNVQNPAKNKEMTLLFNITEGNILILWLYWSSPLCSKKNNLFVNLQLFLQAIQLLHNIFFLF